MRSVITKLENLIRRLLVLSDYLFWLVFDPSKFKVIRKEKIKRILIIHLGAMGELIIATPILNPLKEGLNSKIHFMVSPGKEKVLEGNPNIDKILTYNKDSFFEDIKKERYNLAIIMYPCFLSITYKCMKAGIPYRIGGFKSIREGISFFFTRRMLDLRNKHAVEANLDIIRLIGLDNKNPKLEFYINNKAKEKVNNFLKRKKIKRYAIIHPGFSFSTSIRYPSRWWPPERYAKVADELIKKYKIKVLLTGTNEEKIFSEQIRSKAKNRNNISSMNGLFNIGELAYLISKAELIVAPSTGVIHLASALNSKFILLSGKENLTLWTPWVNKKDYKIVYHPEVCTECDKNYCRKKTQECMLSIKSEEVIKNIDSLLKRD